MLLIRRAITGFFCYAIATSVALAQAQQEPEVKPKVTVERATLKSVSSTQSFTGRVKATSQVDLVSRVPGFIQSIDFKDGGKVAEGDVLIQIEPDEYQAQITQIQGQIKSAESEKTLADIELDRQQKLLAKGDVAENIVQKAQADQGKIDGQLLQLKGSLQAAQLNLSYTKITAPFGGRVGLTNISVGAYVAPESGTLVSLSSIDPIYVEFPVSEAELLDFRKKRVLETDSQPLAVQVTLANGDAYKETGKIAVVDTQVQTGTDTVLIRAEFPNPDGQLLDNQLVLVAVVDSSQAKSLVIPATALQKDQSGYFVLTVGQDGKVARQNIKLDRVAGADAIISDGLKEGDRVITEGLQRAHPGIEVDAVPATAAAGSGDKG